MSHLFLSHAASSADSLKCVENVVHALTNAGYDVFEYRRDVESGESWRVAVLTALLKCEVGVILNDERAGRRKWMRYEKGVLQARQTTPFGRCDVVEVDFARLADAAAIVDIVSSKVPPHAIRGRKGDDSLRKLTQATMRELASDINDVQCKLCIEILIIQQWLAAFLQPLHPIALSALVDKLVSVPIARAPEVDFRVLDRFEQIVPWERTPSAYFIAKHLAQNPAGTLRVFFRSMCEHFGKDMMEQLWQHLSPLVVPLSSIEGLAKLFSREVDASKLLIIETESQYVVDVAIRRAWGVERTPSFAPIIHFDWCEGEAETIEAMISNVDTQIREALQVGDRDAPNQLMLLALTTGELASAFRDQATMAADMLSSRAIQREQSLLRVLSRAPSLGSDNQNDGLWILLSPKPVLYDAEECVARMRTRYPKFPLVLTVPPGTSTAFVDMVRLSSIPPDVSYDLEELRSLYIDRT
jgi:hypothetical protein